MAALVALVCAAMSVSLWWTLERRAEQLEQQGFEARAGFIDSQVRTTTDQYLGQISDLASFAGTHDPPSNEHLGRFALESGVLDSAATQLILYVERVEPDQLGGVIARERAGGNDAFLPITDRLGTGEPLYLLTRAVTKRGPPSWALPIDFGAIEGAPPLLEEAARSRQPVLIDFDLVFREVFEPGGMADRLGLEPELLRAEVFADLGRDIAGLRGLALGVPVGSAHDPDTVSGWVAVGLLPRNRIEGIQRLAGADTAVEVVIVPADDAQLSENPDLVVFGDGGAGRGEPHHRMVGVIDAEGLQLEVTVSGWGRFGAESAYALANVALAAGLGLSVLVAALVYARARFARRTGAVLEQLDRTEHRAFHDELTGLLNRAGLTEELRELVDDGAVRSSRCAVLFIDVDRLKVINDSLGHNVGDLALQEVARRFAAGARAKDRLARFGGDEFVVVCRDVAGFEVAGAIARRMLAALDAPIVVGDAELVLSASVGIAMLEPGGGADPVSLLRDADAAMYRAKASGGGSVAMFDESLRHDATERLELERGLRQAIDTEQVEIHLQPIAEIDTLEVVAHEALVRWRHPTHGLIEPPRFLPVAEETGLIVPMGHQVIDQSAEAASRLIAAGVADPCVAVNLSERQLLDGALFARLQAALGRHGLLPSHLAVEVTEEVIIDGRGPVQRVLRSLRESGHSISIDDFGTGVSSLAALRSLDMVDTVKIDRVFLARIDEDLTDRAIVRAVVAMAEALGLGLVAEGVERLTQLEVLRELGVRRVQGFAIGRPLPVDEVLDAAAGPRDVTGGSLSSARPVSAVPRR